MRTTFKTLLLTSAVMTMAVSAHAGDSMRHGDDDVSARAHYEMNNGDERTADGYTSYRRNRDDDDNYRNYNYRDDEQMYQQRVYTERRYVIENDAAANTNMEAQLSRNEVRQIQQQLRNNGYNLAVDGKLGPQTRAAIRTYQRDNNVQASGMLDRNTLMTMRDMPMDNARIETRTRSISRIAPAAGLSTRPYGEVSYDQGLYLQNRLKMQGYKTPMNGRIDVKTQSSIRQFQTDNGLAVTGSLNEQTISALGVRFR